MEIIYVMVYIYVLMGVLFVCPSVVLDGGLDRPHVKVVSTSGKALREAVSITTVWSCDKGKLKVFHGEHIASCNHELCDCYSINDNYKEQYALYSYKEQNALNNTGKSVLVLTIKDLNCQSSGKYTFCLANTSNCDFNDSVVIDPKCTAQNKDIINVDQGTHRLTDILIIASLVAAGIFIGSLLTILLLIICRKTRKCQSLRRKIASCADEEHISDIERKDQEERDKVASLTKQIADIQEANRKTIDTYEQKISELEMKSVEDRANMNVTQKIKYFEGVNMHNKKTSEGIEESQCIGEKEQPICAAKDDAEPTAVLREKPMDGAGAGAGGSSVPPISVEAEEDENRVDDDKTDPESELLLSACNNTEVLVDTSKEPKEEDHLLPRKGRDNDDDDDDAERNYHSIKRGVNSWPELNVLGKPVRKTD